VADFVPGLTLAARFYRDVVAPSVPVRHAAALLGAGSEVLGLDTVRSTDHDWGPRCQVFVAPDDVVPVRASVHAALPAAYAGWPVAVGSDTRTPRARVEVDTWPRWVVEVLGAEPVDAFDWLVLPQQRLLSVTAGVVLADPDGELGALRERLRWYPDDVWWWLLACQWQRLAQEEPWVQRAAEVGDHLGSRLVAARQVRDVVRLALLVGRTYAPYGKWLGSVFTRLPDPDGLGDALAAALDADTVTGREAALGAAYQRVAARFNALAPDLDVDVSLRSFHDRPATVLGAERFAAAALARVADPVLGGLPLVGAVDQLLDATDALAHPARLVGLRAYYAGLSAAARTDE